VATEGPRKTLRKAIVSDIDRGSLRQILAEATPSRDFDALVTADTDYDKQVSQLIRRANNEGWIGDLVNAVLEARKGKASFVAAVQPIAEQIKKDGELPPDEAPEGRIPTSSAGLWIVLSLLIIGTALATRALSDEFPVWLIPAVILAILFLAFGIATVIAPRQRQLVDLYATDQSLIKGIGVSGLLLGIALATSAFYASNAAWPRIQELTTSLPPADKNYALSVLIAHLEGDDKKSSQTKHVSDSLSDAFPSGDGPRVQLLDAKRTLKVGVSSNEHDEAVATGRDWLNESGADVLVWGEVKKEDKLLRIFLLPREASPTPQSLPTYQLSDSLELEENFNQDLGNVIGARLVAVASPAFESKKFVADLLDKIYPRLEALASNKVIADSHAFCEVKVAMGDVANRLGDERFDSKKLQEAIDTYREILARSSCPTDKAFIVQVQNALGVALTGLGTLEKNTALLEQAVNAFNEALKERSREREPRDWAMAQRNLAFGLTALGTQKDNTALLAQAVDAFNEVLKETPHEHEPFDWAMTQYMLGVTLTELGKREKNTARLNQAVDVFNEVSKELPREREPIVWAGIQYALGNALAELAEQEKKPARLEQAVDAYNAALMEWRREFAPLYWANTQEKLGDALSKLGGQDEQAVDAYNAALQERTREHVPLDWATTQNGLGLALTKWGVTVALGQEPGWQEKSTVRLEQAVDAFKEALRERTREKAPDEWAATQHALGLALYTLGVLEENTARLEQAVDAYNEALKEYTREKAPSDWADTHDNLGDALAHLGKQKQDATRLEQAVAAYNEALKEYTREKVPDKWAATQSNLGGVLWDLGKQKPDAARLEQAVAAYNEALKEYTREKAPDEWAATQSNLGGVMWDLGTQKPDAARLEQAVAAYNEALKEYTREKAPHNWADTQNNLGGVLAALGDQKQDAARLEQAVAAYHASVAIGNEMIGKEGANAQWENVRQTGIDGIGGVAYNFLFTHDFAKALAAADEAISLAPDKIVFYTNRAHALMFLGREDEARALYLQYRGTQNVLGEKSWETCILEDFANLRKAGLTNPLMDEIEKQFTAAG
jgi:tetratricopeptide (TPR) repeat protein